MQKIIDFCERYAPALLVLLVCVPTMVNLLEVNSFHTFFYFSDYSTGFGGRKLLGTLCDLWFPEVVGRIHIYPLLFSVCAIMIGLFAWFCNTCVRQNDLNYFALLVFLFVYLLSPYSFTGFINGTLIDCYVCTATLCFLFVYMKYRGTWYYYILTLLILCVACLTHQLFCNAFFPLVFSLFILDIFMDANNRKKNILLYTIISLCLFVLFCSITVWGGMNVDAETYYNYLQTRVTGDIDLSRKEALYYNFYATLPEHIDAYLIPMWKYNIARFVFTLIVYAPLWLMLWLPWILAIKNTHNIREKWCYILMQVSLHVMIMPTYIMTVDYQRWTYAYCFCQVCMLLVLYSYNADNVIKLQMDKLFNMAREHKIFVLLLAAYLCSYELVTSYLASPIVDSLCKMIHVRGAMLQIVPF